MNRYRYPRGALRLEAVRMKAEGLHAERFIGRRSQTTDKNQQVFARRYPFGLPSIDQRRAEMQRELARIREIRPRAGHDARPAQRAGTGAANGR